MADVIICPVCRAENSPASKICQRCQSPLVENALFQPGQAPDKKDTGELEALLPEWLRDARASAKQPDPLEPFAKEEPKAKPAASNMDLLAGLQSQAADDDEEDVPDWLASITGSSTPKNKPAEDAPETSGVRWVETGTKDDFHQPETPGEEEVPSWLAGIQTPQFGTEEKDELTDWFRETSMEQGAFQPPAQFTPAEEPAPPAPPISFTENDTPDWLKQMAAEAGEKEPEPSSTSSAFDANFDANDWFSQAAQSSNAEPQMQDSAAESFPSDTPDWLNQLQGDANLAPQMQEPAAPNFPTDAPNWLDQLQSDVPAAASAAPEPFNLSNDTPDWLNSLGGASAPFAESTPAESEPFASAGEVPAWLAPESDATKKIDSTPVWLQGEGEAAETPAWLGASQPEQPASAPADVFGDMPDWLKAAAPETSIFEEPAKIPETSKIETPTPQSNAPFAEDAFKVEGSDGLFTEMPDWLSNAMEEPPTPIVPEAITGSDALAPNALPSWVEAMRPSDPGMASIVSASNDLTLESRGALAGLTGVLPAGVGFTPTSKPKAYSLKLNASDEQVKHAEILEQVLAAEAAPVSISTESLPSSSRALRWSLAFILLAVTALTISLRTQIFSMPNGVPNELGYAVAVVQAIPEGAPVLVAVDYEAARAGELEAAAAPLFDNMLLLKHPRLTFISSNEAGTILAERFMAGPMAVHNYQSQVTYLNLGYLAGGQMGVRAFAQNPSLAAPLDIYSQPAWTYQPLQGVAALNQFAAILLITDDAEAARTWVEQTQSARGAVPLVVITSAQAAPMIQPYFDAGQVNGMVSGLYGGALFERHYNSGRPGTARTYWDAYSLGMLLAMMLVLGGGFLNLALGLRDRAAKREGK